MANAGQACEEGNLRKRVSRIDAEGRRSFRPLCGVERSILRRVYRVGGCHVRGVLRPVRTNRPAGPDDHPNGTKTRLLLFPFLSGEGEKSWRRRPIAVLTILLVAVTLATFTHLAGYTPWSPHMNAWSSDPI